MLAALKRGFALLCFLQASENKARGSTIGIHYCHAWCKFIIAILGLVKGIPFVDLFFGFFNKGFIRKSAVWTLAQISGI